MPEEFLNSVIVKYPPSAKNLHDVLIKFIHTVIKRLSGLEKLILFGSYARSKPHYGSDVDLIFLVSTDSKIQFEDVYTELVELSLDFDWAPLIMEVDEFNRRLRESNHWVKTIHQEGKEIWPNFCWHPE